MPIPASDDPALWIVAADATNGFWRLLQPLQSLGSSLQVAADATNGFCRLLQPLQRLGSSLQVAADATNGFCRLLQPLYSSIDQQ